MFLNFLYDNILLKNWSKILDKNQTKELAFSLKIILVGIFFWVIKVRYFTFFWLSRFHLLNLFGYEIVGTILILIGILIIHRVYPFVSSSIAILLTILVLIIHVLDFFLFKYKIYRAIQQYTPILMSLILFIVSKLMERGLHYFGSIELAEKWRNIGIIIFFGFSIPFYTYVSLNVCGFIAYDVFQYSAKFFLLFLPLFLTILYLFFYYIHALFLSFRFLQKVQKGEY